MANVQGTIGNRDNVFRGFNVGNREIGTRTSHAVVTYFHYKKQNFVLPSNLSDFKPSFDTISGVIDSDIVEVSVSKSIQQASGNFSFSLLPSKNWKTVLSPGDWVMIYFFNKYSVGQEIPDSKNCVLLGSIDRVSRSLSRNEEEDKTQLRYNVSGRNFGKVFEEQDVWFDPYTNGPATSKTAFGSELDTFLNEAGLTLSGSPKQLIESLVGIFLGDGGDTGQGRKSGISGWGIPIALAAKFAVADFKTRDALDRNEPDKPKRFFNLLRTEIEDVPGFKDRETITVNSNGSLWDMVERNSNQLTNECYLEESRNSSGDVFPTLFLKPRPISTPFLEDLFANKDAKVKKDVLQGAHKTLQDLAKTNYVEISQAEVKYEDLGKDDHARMNFFWLKTPQAVEAKVNYRANLNETKGISNPVFSRESIQRHGLKRMEQTLEFCYVAKGSAIGVQTDLWKAFMVQLYDFHFANHLYDAGTIECTGVLEAELGKCLIIKEAQEGELPKIYFIEGYEHRWSFQSGWGTTFTLTHGQWLTTGKNIFIDLSDEDFGQLDKMISNTYKAQTETER